MEETMDQPTRRDAFQQTAGLGLLTVLGSLAPAAAADGVAAKVDKSERERVMAVGFTEAEAECWELTANAAGKFFSLPKLHPMDAQEVATAIHVIQNKLLSRPTYRKYLQAAQGQAEPEK
jgi:hypothetical protein